MLGPNRIFTADQNIIIKKVAAVKDEFMTTVVDKIIEIIS